MKKKIIFSSYDDIGNPFYAGGGATAIHQVASRLSDTYDVTVLTGNYKGAKNERKDTILYKRIGPSFFGPKISQLLFYFILPWYVRKEKFDIWIESFTPPFSTSCLQLFTKKPVIGLVHMLSGSDMERKYKLPFQFFEKKGLKTYKYFIVLQEAIKKRIETINKSAQIFVIPNGIAAVYENFEKDSGNDIVFIGRIEYNQKGLDLLIDAYHTIASKVTANLIIAGSGAKQDIFLLKKKIKEYGLEKRIVLIGKIKGKAKDSLLRNCSLVVIPSRFETFSLVALEAMNYGKPIISFAIKGLDWLFAECAKKITPFDTKSFGQMMYTILNDTKLQNEMSVAGRRIAKRYSWENIIEEYKKVVTLLLP